MLMASLTPGEKERVDSNLIWMKVWLKKKHGFLVFSLEMQLAKLKKKVDPS